MRYLAVLFGILAFTACTTALVRHGDSQLVSTAETLAPDLEETSIETNLQFLLTTAASDFYKHRPPDPQRFRDVHFGHLIGSNGEKLYLLCGQFLPAQVQGKPVWTHFATIKTDGYEQYIGNQALIYCNDSAVVWDKMSDLSPLLQSRLDALR